MQKLSDLLASRKFWAAVVGLILMVAKAINPDFPLNEAELTNVVYLLVAYIIGTAVENNIKG